MMKPKRILALIFSLVFPITSFIPTCSYAQENQEMEQSLRELQQQWQEIMHEDQGPARKVSRNRDSDAGSPARSLKKSRTSKRGTKSVKSRQRLTKSKARKAGQHGTAKKQSTQTSAKAKVASEKKAKRQEEPAAKAKRTPQAKSKKSTKGK